MAEILRRSARRAPVWCLLSIALLAVAAAAVGSQHSTAVKASGHSIKMHNSASTGATAAGGPSIAIGGYRLGQLPAGFAPADAGTTETYTVNVVSVLSVECGATGSWSSVCAGRDGDHGERPTRAAVTQRVRCADCEGVRRNDSQCRRRQRGAVLAGAGLAQCVVAGEER